MPGPSSIYLAVDAVIFGYTRERGLSCLLIKRKFPPFQGTWALPGGFVNPDESLEEAVYRELEEETGVRVQYLEQLYSFGDPDRDPRRRVVSVVYFGLVKPDMFQLAADTDAEEASWFAFDRLPSLAFDHDRILEMAIRRVRSKITYEPIGFELLDEKFTFSDLQHLYETLLGRKVDRGNFQKKIKSLGILIPLDEKAKSTGSGRPAKLYRFDEEAYTARKQKGMGFEFESLFVPPKKG